MQPIVYIMTPVWGRGYIDNFFKYCLASMFAADNLPNIHMRSSLHYLLYTTAIDWMYMQDQPAFTRLQQYCSIEFVNIEQGQAESKTRHNRMNRCHNHFLTLATQREAEYMLFVMPDQIFSNGSFAYILDIVTRGCALLMTASLRVEEEGLLEDLAPYSDNLAVSIDDVRLNQLASRRLHPLSRAMIWSNNHLSDCPANIVFDFPDRSILHGFHLHPMAMRVGLVSGESKITIDDDYIEKFLPFYDSVVVNHTSANYCSYDVTHKADTYESNITTQDKILKVAHWAYRRANQMHRKFFAHPMLLRYQSSAIYSGETQSIVAKILHAFLYYEKVISALDDNSFMCEKNLIIYNVARKYMNSLDNHVNQCKQFMRDASRIAIWGGGSTGEHMHEALRLAGFNVVCFFDSFHSGVKLGLPMHNDPDAIDRERIDCVIVTCGMPCFLDEMITVRNTLEERGVKAVFMTKAGAWRDKLQSIGMEEYMLSFLLKAALSSTCSDLMEGEFFLRLLTLMGAENDLTEIPFSNTAERPGFVSDSVASKGMLYNC